MNTLSIDRLVSETVDMTNRDAWRHITEQIEAAGIERSALAGIRDEVWARRSEARKAMRAGKRYVPKRKPKPVERRFFTPLEIELLFSIERVWRWDDDRSDESHERSGVSSPQPAKLDRTPGWLPPE